MTTPLSNHEWESLIDAHLDDSLSPDQAERLQSLLDQDPALIRQLLERGRLHYQIGQALRRQQAQDTFDSLDLADALSIEPEYVQPVRIAPREPARDDPGGVSSVPVLRVEDDTPRLMLDFAGIRIYSGGQSQAGGVPIRRIVAIAAMLALGAFGAWFWLNSESPVGPSDASPVAVQPTPPVAQPQAPAAARVVRLVNTRWAKGVSIDVLEPGDAAELSSGFVEIEFVRGARVVIEGPCRFIAIDDNTLRVETGRVVANVPPSARLFTIDTPTARIVDYGTEFGVDVNQTGETRVAVFQGLVELGEGPTEPGRISQHVALSAGQVSSVSQDRRLAGSVQDFHVAQQSLFVRSIEEAGDPAIAYARAIRALKPIAYWPMTGDRPTLGDSLGLNNQNLQLVGDHPVQRMAAPQTLRSPQHFTDALRIDRTRGFYTAGPIPAETWKDNAYSITLWMRVSEWRAQNVVALVPDLGARAGHFSSQIRMDDLGRIEHYTFFPTSENPGLEWNLLLELPADRTTNTNQWTHVVATYGDGRSRLYIDGQLVAEQEIGLRFEAGYPTLLVGGATGFGTADHRPENAMGDFDGALCQLALFNHALTTDQVQALYQSPTPDLAPDLPMALPQ